MTGWLASRSPQLFVGVFGLVCAVSVLVLVSMCTPKVEPIIVELSVDRVQFRVVNPSTDQADSEANSVRSSPLSFLDLSLSGFAQIRHEGDSSIKAVTVSLPPRKSQQVILISSSKASEGYSESAVSIQKAGFSANPLRDSCIKNARQRDSGYAVAGTETDRQTVGRLGSLVAKPGARVVLESADHSTNSYVISLEGGEISTSLNLSGSVALDLQAGSLRVDDTSYPSGRYLVELTSPHVATVTAGKESFQTSFRLPCESGIGFLHGGTAPWIRDIKFEKTSEVGIWSSSVHSATVSYPEHSFLTPVAVKAPSGIFFGEKTELRLENAQTNPETGLIDLQLSGKTSSFHKGTRDYDESHAVTYFQVYWPQTWMVAIIGGLVGLLSLLSTLAGTRWSDLAHEFEKKNGHKLFSEKKDDSSNVI